LAHTSKAATSSRTPKTRNLALTEALPGHNPASRIGDADYDKKELTVR
jgi:hypothetical protein